MIVYWRNIIKVSVNERIRWIDIAKGICITIVLWGIGLGVQYIVNGHMFNYFSRSYPLWPFCYLVAIMGIFAILEISKGSDERGRYFGLDWLGKNSMTLLCVHALDAYWTPLLSVLPISCFAIIRIVVDVGLTVILYHKQA